MKNTYNLKKMGYLLPVALISATLVLSSCFDSSNDNDDKIVVDNSTYTQVDRMGIPALNTVFNHPAAFSKKDYNTAGPDKDKATYMERFKTVLGAVANADPAATANVLLADELPVSLGSATSFATLTGRAPSDDAVDVALGLVIGSSLSVVHSDNVDANDKAFLATFPYLADNH